MVDAVYLVPALWKLYDTVGLFEVVLCSGIQWMVNLNRFFHVLMYHFNECVDRGNSVDMLRYFILTIKHSHCL